MSVHGAARSAGRGIRNQARAVIVRAAWWGLAGLATTVAVAWAGVALVQFSSGSRIAGRQTYEVAAPSPRGSPFTHSLSVIQRDLLWGGVHFHSYCDPIAGTRGESTEAAGISPPTLRRHLLPWEYERPMDPATLEQERMAVARGWPLQALWCGSSRTRMSMNNDLRRIGGITIPWSPHVQDWFVTPWTLTALPYLPVWRGLLIDSALYGSAWLGVITLMRRTRPWLRRRRGCCGRCGYSVLGLPRGAPCPECGWSPWVATTHA